MSTAASPQRSDPACSGLSAVVVMGVCGAGKTTIGQGLAAALGWSFRDGDHFHPAANLAKMRARVPLDDADRAPWLEAIGRALRTSPDDLAGQVIACSALKAAYRRRISETAGRPVLFIHLTGPRELLRQRLRRRQDHFMPPDLLDSQIETLEPPGPDEHALAVSIADPVEAVIATLLAAIAAQGVATTPTQGQAP